MQHTYQQYDASESVLPVKCSVYVEKAPSADGCTAASVGDVCADDSSMGLDSSNSSSSKSSSLLSMAMLGFAACKYGLIDTIELGSAMLWLFTDASLTI